MAKFSSVVLIVLAALAASSGRSAAYRPGFIRQTVQWERGLDVTQSFFDKMWGVLCVVDVSQLLEDHEGRHKCSYDHEGGYRAVGAGYNLDDDKEQRKSELSTLFADYDKVHKGEDCLNEVQITALLALDAKRDLDRVRQHVKPLDDFCCSVQAVFADIQHASGGVEDFPTHDLKEFIEMAALKKYKDSAHKLENSRWCSKEENEKRCQDNLKVLKKGC